MEDVSSLRRRLAGAVAAAEARAAVAELRLGGAFTVIHVGGLRSAEDVRRGIAAIVGKYSLSQSAKGIVSAGVRTSLLYALRKVGKRFRG